MVEEIEHQGYEAPSVKDLGTLEAITGATTTGVKNEGGSVKT